MAKPKASEIRRDRGKFDTIVDGYVYSTSLDGVDEEAGSSSEAPGLWAGLLRGDMLESVEAAARENKDALTEDERDLLRQSVGAIMTEDTQGFVHVEYYDDAAKLERDWKALEEDLSIPEDEDDEG